jgi:hypothetical protein
MEDNESDLLIQQYFGVPLEICQCNWSTLYRLSIFNNDYIHIRCKSRSLKLKIVAKDSISNSIIMINPLHYANLQTDGTDFEIVSVEVPTATEVKLERVMTKSSCNPNYFQYAIEKLGDYFSVERFIQTNDLVCIQIDGNYYL